MKTFTHRIIIPLVNVLGPGIAAFLVFVFVLAMIPATVLATAWLVQWAWGMVAVARFGAPSFDFRESVAIVLLLSVAAGIIRHCFVRN